MENRLVIFGNGDLAQLAHYYFETDSDYKVIAFTVDAAFVKESSFCGLPVVAFEDLTTHYPPETCTLFIAVGYSQLNALRKEKVRVAQAMGYRLARYISSHAMILNNGRIGDHCFILEGNVLQPFAVIGNNVMLWSGNHIGHHAIIQDHCFLASHVVVSGRVAIGEQCFIGVNATLRDGIKVGDRCIIGAGCLLLVDAAEDGIYKCQTTPRANLPSYRLSRI